MTFFRHSLEISRFSPPFSTLTLTKLQLQLHNYSPFTTANDTTAEIVISYTLKYAVGLIGLIKLRLLAHGQLRISRDFR